jgi:L-seryl-tRNA(Ser) seleniumtransferase
LQDTKRAHLRQIPSVEKILTSDEFATVIERFGRAGVKEHLTGYLDQFRRSAGSRVFSLAESAGRVEEMLVRSRTSPLRRVINGTGIIVHTNLGRSPIDPRLWDEAAGLVAGYSNLEFDVEEGERGKRDEHIRGLAAQVFGCEAAILVNNNAAAVLLLLATIAAKKDVLVSRGELVEIGGSFRVPEVIEQGGARLVEVGTTNRTRVRDYADAITRRTAAILKVHRSNFQIVGFTETTNVDELIEVAHAKKVPVVMDEGSGRVVDLGGYGFARQPTVRELLDQGVDVVTCSTDKLIGALQGGLIMGRSEIVDRCAKHPLMRALRVGKESYGTLAATLRSFLAARHEQEIPIYRMLATPLEELRDRASRIGLGEVTETRSALGGGTTPTETIPSFGVAFRGRAESMSESLRRWDPPIIGRIERDRYILDLRTILPSEDAIVSAALRATVSAV